MNPLQTAGTIRKIFLGVKNYLLTRDWPEIVLIIKIILIILSILFFVGIVILIIKLNLLPKAKERGRMLISPTHFPKKLTKKWAKIEDRIKSRQEAELKLAVIEADKFFDDVLKRYGYVGEDAGGRLKRINSSQISNIDDIWQAHKIRNNIVHDINYTLTSNEAEKAIGSYKKGLEELEVL